MPQYIRPPALRPGDTVAVVSPAGPVTPELLEGGIATLESWGLDIMLHDAVFERREWAGYLAGHDHVRLGSLREALDDPKVRAIVFSRGGYGTMRLLPELGLAALRDDPKLLVGFSDITALHLHLAAQVGITSLHGPVVKSFRLHDDDPHDSLEELRRALFGLRGPRPRFDGLRTVRPGRATGPVFGGNLSLVASLVASPHCPDLNGAILVLEDVGEEDYRLDRLFTTLRLSEKARRPAGIVLGDFTGCAGAYVDDEAMDDFVARLAAEFDCPVVAGLPCGHATRNVPVPIGVGAALDAERGTLIFDGDAVTPGDS
ncbi:LD-carboxypeptidase [Persicimonas caeni]|uniref:LD-carboxypeptidase n=1 Tax=Persicimonas caeni TaxID=2292766 RepID=A0A4Y6PLW0_PERCE|nr:LD-carboxypeptidase [Persicimonas caeni]QDG49252.1 LD-carboxypeptidase [Persicimonas caeni]QED30473.1 LD-carboxypeptidase [Persicimonas caeni]